MPKFYVVIEVETDSKEEAANWGCSVLDTFFRYPNGKPRPVSEHPYKPRFVRVDPWVEREIQARFQDVVRPLVDIANAFDSNNLDDEARRSWGPTGIENVNMTPADEIELCSGRGGKQLLTLADCFRARECVGGKGDTRDFSKTVPTREEIERIREESGNDPKVAKLLALIDATTDPGMDDIARHAIMKQKGFR